jgi:hypothetical protein
MLQKSSEMIMQRLKPSDVVLDIGGWAHPFNRANYVLDMAPYETRGFYNRTFARNNPIPPIGGKIEMFTKESWIVRDICAKEPFPFRDKEFDFVVCSHTLEDIRDPLWVCSEIIRIGKAGYIEVPSRLWETCRGMEPGIAGLSHHRWLIDIDPGANSIRFLQKLHRIHNWRYSLPHSVLRKLPVEQTAQWLLWNGSFEFWEEIIHGEEAQLQELERFVRQHHSYSKVLLEGDARWLRAMNLYRRAVNKGRRMLAARRSAQA